MKTISLLGPLTRDEEGHIGPSLWVDGDVELAAAPARVAVVGSRKVSEAGLRRAAKISSQLAKAGVVVVSGLARGVDVAAHRGCLRAGGRTIAVIGTPLERSYPLEHTELQAQLARDHLVVSPFDSRHVTKPADFVHRNRVMALLVHASVVVEAGENSGTKSHAMEVLRIGRPLFVMRSLLKHNQVRWPAQAVELGAIVLDDVEQVLEALPVRPAA